jgi:hypothetical protein
MFGQHVAVQGEAITIKITVRRDVSGLQPPSATSPEFRPSLTQERSVTGSQHRR